MRLLFHLGLHKTGSSWLQTVYFQNHPDIIVLNDFHKPWNDPFLKYLVKTPETHFDASTCRHEFDLLYQKAGASGGNENALYTVSAERLSGHPFSGAYDRAQILRRINEVFPESRVLLVIRSQPEAITSVFRQIVAEGSTARIEELFKQDSWKSCGFSLSYWDYYEYVDMAQKLFGKNGVEVFCYEHLRSDIDDFLHKLSKSLGISRYKPAEPEEIVNPGLPDMSINTIRRLNHIRQSELNPRPLLKLNIVYRWLYWITVRSGVPGNSRKPLLSEDLRRQIIEHYTENNRLLQSLVGHDLERYGYY